MLNWHFLANQFLCPCFSCSFLPVGIPFVPSGILEACSQIPFQASFARLLSLPVCCWKTSSPPHYSSLLPWNGYLFPFQFIFSKKGSVELWLAFLPRSCASETLPASAGNPFLGVILAFSWLHCIWTYSHLMFGSNFPSDEFPHSQFSWLGLRKCFGSVCLLLSHSLLWSGTCHLPSHPLQNALIALCMCVCYSRK